MCIAENLGNTESHCRERKYLSILDFILDTRVHRRRTRQTTKTVKWTGPHREGLLLPSHPGPHGSPLPVSFHFLCLLETWVPKTLKCPLNLNVQETAMQNMINDSWSLASVLGVN